jgi:hypothetical protein
VHVLLQVLFHNLCSNGMRPNRRQVRSNGADPMQKLQCHEAHADLKTTAFLKIVRIHVRPDVADASRGIVLELRTSFLCHNYLTPDDYELRGPSSSPLCGDVAVSKRVQPCRDVRFA